MDTRCASGYPRVWVRWATQQVSVAVSCELSVANRLMLPHLRRLPLTINAPGVEAEKYLRDLIAVAASGIAADAEGRVAIITDAVLADSSVCICEPDLEMMVAWWLAEHYPLRDGSYQQHDLDDDEHECIDPEALAAELVRSGLIVPAWKYNELSELAAHNLRTKATTPPARRIRRSTVSPLQMAFPI